MEKLGDEVESFETEFAISITIGISALELGTLALKLSGKLEPCFPGHLWRHKPQLFCNAQVTIVPDQVEICGQERQCECVDVGRVVYGD